MTSYPVDVFVSDDECKSTRSSPADLVNSPVHSPAPPLKSILVLDQCHDCSLENVRMYVDGQEVPLMTSSSPYRRHNPCRLPPSPAATAVLQRLSVRPLNDDQQCRDDDSDDDCCDSAYDLVYSATLNRKYVRFSDVIHVFDDCEETVEDLLAPCQHQQTLIRPMAAATCRRNNCTSSSSLPPLLPPDLPPVVQKYMTTTYK